jgi:sulfide dehydrogenase [flavocytochrome c] flavoprotein subunit
MSKMRRRQFVKAGAMAAAGVWTRAVAATMSLRKARVIVIGGGFAGASCALHLRRLNRTINLVLIDPDEHYVTCPMSNEAIVGLRSIQSITVSRAGLMRAGVRIVRDEVAAIDGPVQRVRLGDGTTLPYDRLVVAPGIRFLWGTPEGYDEAASERMPHAWKAGVQTELLAEQLRTMPDGGIVAISVPRLPYRCPPGPYERASLIARHLKENKPRSKILIFDTNNQFPRQDVFTEAWQTLYPGLIEWIPVTEGGAVHRIDSQRKILYTEHGGQPVAVANIIPPQAPGLLALDAGLASGHGWCPIKATSFESQRLPNVHVIGDACIADPMPKSASSASSQAQQCARAVIAALQGREPPQPFLHSACFSLIAPNYGLAITGAYHAINGELRRDDQPGQAGQVEPAQVFRALEAQRAHDWYREIRSEAFGV